MSLAQFRGSALYKSVATWMREKSGKLGEHSWTQGMGARLASAEMAPRAGTIGCLRDFTTAQVRAVSAALPRHADLPCGAPARGANRNPRRRMGHRCARRAGPAHRLGIFV